MRYSLQRYDNVFGTSDVTLICDDVYFDRSETQYYGDGFNTLDDALSAITNFLGSDDYLNINGLHYIPNGDMPYYNKVQEIVNRFHLTPYSGITYDDTFHAITGIIKIDNKTTTCDDFGMGRVGGLPSRGGGEYHGGYVTAQGYNAAPWTYDTIVTGNSTLTGGGVAVYIAFFAFPSDTVTNGFVVADEHTLNAKITVEVDANYNLLGIVTDYVARVRVTEGSGTAREVYEVINQLETPIQDDPNSDPYSGDTSTGGQSSTGGGHYTPSPTGTYSPLSDPNPVPSLPSLSASDTGFITLFNPTSAQLKNLANYMWGSLFDVDTWKKIFADPMDCILGLAIVPVNVPSSGTDTVKVGNISTGISMNKANTQFIEVDCGTLSITEYWNAYLDYSPYTKLNIFLPYIGSHELNIDDIQVNTVGVKYHIDILSGACVAYITAGGNVIAQYSGQCAISIPITSKDFTQTIIALGTLVAGGVAGIATGGLSAPITAASVAGGVTAAANTAANVATSKPSISKSGNMGGSNGLMGVQTPYLFITRPKQCAPKNQNRYTGYPSYITERMGNLSGFTQIQEIRLDGISCTDEERNEIMSLLRNGVII